MDLTPVIAIMNTAYGDPEGQMFDVKRRHAIRYSLPADSDKAAIERVQESLTKDIKDALLTILKEVVFPRKGKAATERFDEIRTKFESDVREGRFHRLHHPSPAVAITLVPDAVTKISYQVLDSTNVPFFRPAWGRP